MLVFVDYLLPWFTWCHGLMVDILLNIERINMFVVCLVFFLALEKHAFKFLIFFFLFRDHEGMILDEAVYNNDLGDLFHQDDYDLAEDASVSDGYISEVCSLNLFL